MNIWDENDVLIFERHRVAHAMAMNHINNDLRRALEDNGVGYDPVWDCIGDVVQACQNKNTYLIEQFGAFVGRKVEGDVLDVKRIRDKMRERIRGGG